MFAASLNTLKRRTTQLLKGEEGKRNDDDTLDSLEYAGIESVNSFAPVGNVIIRYELQHENTSDPEEAAFLVPLGDSDGLSVGTIRSKFPMPGQYHFRFKAPTSDGSFGGYVWVDLANDGELAPTFRGDIHMKVLKLPDTVSSRSQKSLSAGQTSASQLSRPGLGTASPGGSGLVDDSPSPPLPRGVPAAEPMLLESDTAVPAAPPRRSVAPPDDLMELGVNMCMQDQSPARSLSASPTASPPAPSPPPVVMLDRNQLVAEREAKEKARVDEANRVHQERRMAEDQLKKDKLKMSNKLYDEMDRWAKTPDGQSFKDIRTLLSTMHNVVWQGSGWQQLSLAELVAKDSNVKKYYRKAILMCHPDKQTEADPEQQVRADRIFNALNEAFKAES